MADILERQIDVMLQNGEDKKAIFKKFDKPELRNRLVLYLNNKTTIARRHKYMWVNLSLGLALLGMTLRRLLLIAEAGHFDYTLLADFIVPTINFYILKEIFRFHRTGYQFLAVLTSLSLIIYEQNRILPDLFINAGMVALAVFLYMNLFPKKELIKVAKE